MKESWCPSRRRGEDWSTCETEKQDHFSIDASAGTSTIESPQASLWVWRTQCIAQHNTCASFITRSSASGHALMERPLVLRYSAGLGACAPSREYGTHALELMLITLQNVKVPPPRRGAPCPPMHEEGSDVGGSTFFGLANQIPEFLRRLPRVSPLDACSIE